MNNKGFAITGILYGVLLLFLMVLASLLYVLVVKINRFTTLVDEVSESIENKNETPDDYVTTINIGDSYTTPYRGKYTFTINSNTCYAYLPKDIELKIDGNKIQANSVDLTLINCINGSISNFEVSEILTSNDI